MSYYRLAAEALADLEDIWLYIALDSPAAADRFVDVLADRIALIATQPHLGRVREELAPGPRSFPVRGYLIFYRLTEDGIEIARAIEGHRDLGRLF